MGPQVGPEELRLGQGNSGQLSRIQGISWPGQRPQPMLATMSDPIARLTAALEGRYRIERELGEGDMATVASRLSSAVGDR
jgi:hypothetical protein